METRRHRLVAIAALLAITALGAWLRLHQIDRLPPGDGYDPAYYGLDALEILDGARPVFFETNIGREAMFSYLVALCFLVLGPGTLAIHVASAIVGILTIPAIYLVADELFSADCAEDSLLARFGGLLAALMVAVSFWHLQLSRYGVRAILVPLFSALTVTFLWRGLRTGSGSAGSSRWAFAACGLFLGLSMYTYQAARILPLLIVLGFVYVAWLRESFSVSISRTALVNLALVALVALIVFAPMGYYSLTHPGSLSERIEQVTLLNEDQPQQSQGLLRTLSRQGRDLLLWFSVRGDDEPYLNVPGRPALNPFLAAAFFLGAGISLARARKPRNLFLLTWLGLMSLPALLALQGPATKRAIGTLPAVAMFVAVGLLVPLEALRRWAADRRPSWSGPLSLALTVAIAAGFVYSGVVTYRDYFVVWPQDLSLFTHFEKGFSLIGEYAGRLPPEEQVYISPHPPEHPTIVLHSNRRENLKGYNGRVCLVLPRRPLHDTTYVVARDDTESLEHLQRYFPGGGIAAEGPLRGDAPYYQAYRIRAGNEARVEPSHPREVNWDQKIELLGYDLQNATYRAGETLHLTLYFEGLGEMEANYTLFVHLLGPQNPDTGSPLWAQDDSEPCRYSYRTSGWDVGEIVIDRFALPIPADAPPGEYELATGLYQWPTFERLPVIDVAAGAGAPGIVTLTQVQITAGE